MNDFIPDHEPARERLASRLGFILLSAGCAIGLGNVWRFPYIAGQNGGGWFVAIYLVFLALIGLPVLVMEFTTGRAAQKSIVGLHKAIVPEKPLWRLHGYAGFAGNICLMMFYTVVTGWMLIYFYKTLTGAFAGMTPAEIGGAFNATLDAPGIMTIAMLIATVFSSVVCATGLQKGVERVTKVMMSLLIILLVALAIHSCCLKGAEKGLAFYLIPDFARMQQVGVARVIVEAMNHAFFTLSLGIGSMAIFGSYIGRDHALLGESVRVAAIDTFVAVLAGLVIIPACFAFGVDQAQGPGLVFVSLPNVFEHMALGRVWGSAFFLFMSCAALTTVIAVLENIIACVRDMTGMGRVRASVLTGVAVAVLSLPCLLGFNVLSGFQPFGAGSCVLDLEDFVVSNLLLPLGGLAFVLFCGHRYGWGWEKFRAEANLGRGLKVPGGAGVRVYCLYVLPVLVAAIFVLGVLEKFGVIRL